MEYHMKEIFSEAQRSESMVTPAAGRVPRLASTQLAAAISHGGRETTIAKPGGVPSSMPSVSEPPRHVASDSYQQHRAVEDAVAQTNSKVVRVWSFFVGAGSNNHATLSTLLICVDHSTKHLHPCLPPR